MNKGFPHAELIFAEAIELADRGARAACLDRACGGDEALRHEVESLLLASEKGAGFMRTEGMPDALTVVQPAERPGDRIARYKLLEPIGEGGFGIVWMAEQEEPVRRRVALKVIKMGMDTRQVVARFEVERQALALMDHPNIARVFDGGATESGRPFFVMEYVRGVPITTYCDQHKLSLKERLGLFVQVCQAVQHAHQKGVIHRDLKPSNILVTIVDGVATPKVIDFGIAKATAQPLTEKTLFTGMFQVVGTPAYMSPEQAAMNHIDIDTRSDVYTLGILLYELLTGRLPFSKDELMSAGLAGMCRVIRESDPPRPSTRLGQLDDEERSQVAACRRSNPSVLNRLVRGDLDWIVMKALEKDRSRRYETANGLVKDIQRYLAEEPVSAAAPSWSYAVGKFARKHRFVLGTWATCSLLLLAAGVVSVWEAHQASHHAAEAMIQRRIATSAAAQATLMARESEIHRQRAEEAQRLAAEARRALELSRIEADRPLARVGRRVDTLAAISKASSIVPTLQLRNQAIGVLALADIRSTVEWLWRPRPEDP